MGEVTTNPNFSSQIEFFLIHLLLYGSAQSGPDKTCFGSLYACPYGIRLNGEVQSELKKIIRRQIYKSELFIFDLIFSIPMISTR